MTHPQRCETCQYRWNKPDGIKCPFQNEKVYYTLKDEVRIPDGTDLFTSIVGCASHSSSPVPEQFPKPNDEQCRICEQSIRQDEREKVLDKPKFNSTDLLLLANDEWKRREERKHNHDPQSWQAGFINGFLTDWKWARDYVDKLRQQEQP